MKKILCFMMVALISCGGGGGSSSQPPTTPPNTNSPPVINTTVSEIEIEEGIINVLTLQASDSDGDSLRYSLSGEDPSYFNISGEGEITFRETSVYDQKNKYAITVEVSDNQLTTSKNFIIYLLKVCTDSLLGFDVCIGDKVTSVYYDRDGDYPTWDDSDSDCQSNRHEVLIQEHIDNDANNPLTYTSSEECYVQSGKWYDPYDDVYYFLASEVQIDHVVALYEAHISGAWYFPDEKKRKFANSLENDDQLIAVGASSNQQKGASSPVTWLPSNLLYRCEYLRKWVSLKAHFRLNIDNQEKQSILDYNTDFSCSLEPIISSGTPGNDNLIGGEGNDVLSGGDGDDVINGLGGNDILDGGAGSDSLTGGNGNDTIYGFAGGDTLEGNAGEDILNGGDNFDTLDGGDGNDILDGHDGKDSYTGGNGNDIFVIREGDGSDGFITSNFITDFEDNTDLIGLDNGLAFAELTIGQGTAGSTTVAGYNFHYDYTNHTLVRVTETGEYLFTIMNSSSSDITEADFTAVDIDEVLGRGW